MRDAAVADGTIIEIVGPNEARLPQRRAMRSNALAASDILAEVVQQLADGAHLEVNALNFRKALEALAPASLSAQISDLSCFARFCAADRREALPATETTIVAYVEHLERSGLRPATVARRLSSIASVHALVGVPSPTSASVIKHAMKAFRRRAGVAQKQAAGLRFRGVGPQQGKALTLSALLETCGGDCRGLRDAALLSLGYDAGLRVSELIAVEVDHIEQDEDGSGVLFIPRAKTDQAGEGAYAWISADTMRRIQQWLDMSGVREGPIFRRIAIERRAPVAARPPRMVWELAPNAHVDRARLSGSPALPARVRFRIGNKGLTRQGVNLIYRQLARQAANAGLVDLQGEELEAAVAALSTHSLRVGLTQDLFAAGEDAGPIAQALRWRSPVTALRYARKLAPRANAAARFLKTLRS